MLQVPVHALRDGHGEGGQAEATGKLKERSEIVSINGTSLLGYSRSEAAKLIDESTQLDLEVVERSL